MFPTREVISASAAAHRLNDGFIKKDQIRFDEKCKNKPIKGPSLTHREKP